MPNFFEINGDGLDDLVIDSSGESTEPSTSGPTEGDTPDNEDLMDSLHDFDDQADDGHLDESQVNEEDFLVSFLSEYGLKNGKVTYENEDGDTEEVDFNDLDSKEKLSILKELTTPNLSKDEIEVINYLRSNNATIQDVISYYSQKAIDDYIKEHGPVEKQYSIDEYSDDDLYIADLKSKFDNMSEEDLKTDLEIAKENEELFKKKVDIIRKHYKEQEDAVSAEKAKEQEVQFNNFKTSVENQLTEFNQISMDYKDSKSDSLQIEDSEKDEIFKYILNQDENGATQFFKDLNNPQTLVELAWFALYGKDAISDITNYWKSQLKSLKQKAEPKTQTTVIRSDKKQKDNFINHHKSVETVFGDDLL